MDWTATLPLTEAAYPWAIALVFVVGLCVGSFVNVMGLRLLADVPLSNPPSHCPVCKTPIAWYDNIPVLSYLFLGGACRHCESPISPQYPIMELVSGLLFVLVFLHFGLSWGSLLLAVLVMNLLSIVITDWKESLIFHINSIGLIPFGLAYNLFGLDKGLTTWTDWSAVWLGNIELSGAFLSALAGVLGAFLLFEGAILLSQWVFGTEGFGHGDTFLLMGVASYLGWELAVFIFVAGLLLQGVLAIPLLIFQWIQQRQWLNLSLALGCLAFAMLPYLPIFGGGQLLALMLCYLLSIGCLVAFLWRVRQSGSFTYMPLGPSLVVATLLAVFGAQSWLLPIREQIAKFF